MVTGFVLAAGFGTRMGELTRACPKPLLIAAGAPLIAHALFLIRRIGLPRTVVNVHYHADQLETWLRGFRGMEIRISRETQIMGTAGGITGALSLIEDPFILIVNPDVLLWPTVSLNAKSLVGLLGDADALLFVAPRLSGDVTGFSMDGSGTLQFDDGGPLYYLGLSVMRVSALEHLPEGYSELGPLWRELAARGRLRGVRFEGDSLDVGTADTFLQNQHRQVPLRLELEWRRFLSEAL